MNASALSWASTAAMDQLQPECGGPSTSLEDGAPMPTITERYFRFEDDELQATLVREIERASIAYRRGGDGVVIFGEDHSSAIMLAVNRVRDAQFPWYLQKWNAETEADRYREILKKAGLPFVAERHEDGTWFLVRRQDRAQHDELWRHVQDDEGGISGP